MASIEGVNRSLADRSSLLSKPAMVMLFEYAAPPAKEKLPASSGVGRAFLSSARSRVDKGSSATAPNVNIKSSGERDAFGNASISRVVTVPPTTVRVVSTCVGSAVLTTTASAGTAQGFI